MSKSAIAHAYGARGHGASDLPACADVGECMRSPELSTVGGQAIEKPTVTEMRPAHFSGLIS